MIIPSSKVSKLVSHIVSNKADVYLSSSILLETACTLCISNVNQNKLWFIPIYTGYGISFYLFPKSFVKYSVSTAYTLWSGFGIVLTFIIDLLLQRETFHIKKALGMSSILFGIFIIKNLLLTSDLHKNVFICNHFKMLGEFSSVYTCDSIAINII